MRSCVAKDVALVFLALSLTLTAVAADKGHPGVTSFTDFTKRMHQFAPDSWVHLNLVAKQWDEVDLEYQEQQEKSFRRHAFRIVTKAMKPWFKSYEVDRTVSKKFKKVDPNKLKGKKKTPSVLYRFRVKPLKLYTQALVQFRFAEVEFAYRAGRDLTAAIKKSYEYINVHFALEHNFSEREGRFSVRKYFRKIRNAEIKAFASTSGEESIAVSYLGQF